MKTSKIKNVDQYYIVKELLDGAVSEIPAEERKELSDGSGDYELATRR